MFFELHPPDAAGPLRIGATGRHTLEILKQLGDPLILCRTPSHAWSVERPSGLFIATYFDADHRVEAIAVGRPVSSEDTVSYDGINVFAVPAEELLDFMRARTNIVEIEEDDGSSFLAPDLHLGFWRPPDPTGPDDIDNRFMMSIRLTRYLSADRPRS